MVFPDFWKIPVTRREGGPSEHSLRLKAITRSRPIRSNFKKERDRSLIGKARIKARKQPRPLDG